MKHIVNRKDPEHRDPRCTVQSSDIWRVGGYFRGFFETGFRMCVAGLQVFLFPLKRGFWGTFGLRQV